MKNFFLPLLTILFLFFNSCADTEDVSETNHDLSAQQLKVNDDVVFRKYEDLINFTHFHQIAVDLAADAFQDEFEINPDRFIDERGKLNKISFVNFFLDQSTTFINNNPLLYKDQVASLDFLKDLTDQQKLELFHQVVRDNDAKNIQDENISRYYKRISVAVFENSENKEAFHQFLNDMYNETFTDNSLNSTQINAIHMMIGIGYDSFNNWFDTTHEIASKGPRKKLKATGTTVLADIVEGAGGAIWGGAVAGPVGAVLMGVNCAIIGSGMELTLSNSIGNISWEW